MLFAHIFLHNLTAKYMLCLGAEEETWSLNIKKGVISAFQASVNDWNVEDVVTEVRS